MTPVTNKPSVLTPDLHQFRVPEGWIEIYHGASKNHRYCLGVALLDAEDPTKVIARSEHPLLEPQEPYELEGFFGNVIFNNGVLFEEGLVKIYYGAADTVIGYAEVGIDDIMAELNSSNNSDV